MKVRVIGSGSRGNATIVETASCNILIDAGLTYKNISERLGGDVPNIDIVVITHTHKDHIGGLKSVLKKDPIVYTMADLGNLVSYDKINNERQFSIGDTSLKLFDLSHDSYCCGMIISDGDKELVYITDTGYINKKYFDILSNRNVYVMESNHDIEMLNNGSYPFNLRQRILSDKGHLSNYDSAKYLSSFIGNNTKCIILAHLSEDNNTEELAYNTLIERLNDSDTHVDNIIIAKQNKETELVKL